MGDESSESTAGDAIRLEGVSKQFASFVAVHRAGGLRDSDRAGDGVHLEAQASGRPVLTITRRVRTPRPQAGLSAAGRRRNLKGAFSVTGPPACRHPLIVDDVVTTGETCAQLARALKAAGCEEVSVLAAARASKGVEPLHCAALTDSW